MSTDPYKYFRVEARELAENLSKGVLDLEKGQSTPELISLLLRYAHTLKGAARIVKKTRISELSHALEEILAMYRDRPSEISPDEPGRMLQMIDGIFQELASLDKPEDRAATRAESDLNTETDRRGAEDVFSVLRIKTAEMDALIRAIGEARAQVSGLAGQLEELRSNNGRRTMSEWSGLHESIKSRLEAIDRLLASSYETGSELRLVPVNSIFGLLERTARDAAVATGKRVQFQSDGGQVRLGAHTLQLLREALIHLVRNAVAHGIEAPDDRKALGKDESGQVSVSVQRSGDQAVFVCRDDGAGVNLQRVREAAWSKGLITPEQGQSLTPEKAFELLLQGGMTTIQNPSEIAGRGVGLDIVRQSIQSLKGSVSVFSEPGMGTRIELTVPVLIESLEILEVRAGAWNVAVPLRATRQVLRIKPGDINSRADGEGIVFGQRMVPFVPLIRILDESAVPVFKAGSALILQAQGGTAAVGVDLVGIVRREIVRSVPDAVHSVPLAAGAFIDPQGHPRLVLDPTILVTMAIQNKRVAERPSKRTSPPLLVIDDSLTTRMLEQGILESAGFEVDTAGSGEEALEKARARHYGVFLVDVEMPGMDGFEFLREANADPELRGTPSIIVTSREAPSDLARAEQLGVESYIVKSRFDQDLLLRTIRKLVG